jgi:hypothetical protein
MEGGPLSLEVVVGGCLENLLMEKRVLIQEDPLRIGRDLLGVEEEEELVGKEKEGRLSFLAAQTLLL